MFIISAPSPKSFQNSSSDLPAIDLLTSSMTCLPVLTCVAKACGALSLRSGRLLYYFLCGWRLTFAARPCQTLHIPLPLYWYKRGQVPTVREIRTRILFGATTVPCTMLHTRHAGGMHTAIRFIRRPAMCFFRPLIFLCQEAVHFVVSCISASMRFHLKSGLVISEATSIAKRLRAAFACPYGARMRLRRDCACWSYMRKRVNAVLRLFSYDDQCTGCLAAFDRIAKYMGTWHRLTASADTGRTVGFSFGRYRPVIRQHHKR